MGTNRGECLFPAALLWLFTACAIARAQWPLSDAEYAETKELAHEFLRNYSPTEYVYLFPGRSCGTLARYLQLLDPRYAHQFPLSGFRHQVPGVAGNRPESAILPRDREHYRPITPEEEKKLFTHFDLVLPTEAELAGKEILLVDYGNGDSLHATETYLKRYGEARGRNLRLKTVLLFDPTRGNVAAETELNRNRFDRLVNMKQYPTLRGSMYIEDPELYTPVGQWRLSQDAPGRVKNHNTFNVEAMDRALTNRIERDLSPPRHRPPPALFDCGIGALAR